MEGTDGGGSSIGVCEVGVEGPTTDGAIVPEVRVEPKKWVQMDEAVRGRGNLWTARSDASTASLAPTDRVSLAGANSTSAPTTSPLGKPQTSGAVAQAVFWATASVGPNHRQLAQANETECAWSSAFAPRAAVQAQRIDAGAVEQPCVDGRLQGVVSNAGWPSGRPVDGAGYVQPVCADDSVAGQSEREAGATGISEVVWKTWLSEDHPNGQWESVCIDGCSRAFAAERLVDSVGNTRGIHRAGASRTEWRARADASGIEGRNDATAFAPSTGTTTADETVGWRLQCNPSPRGIAAADADRSLSCPAWASAPFGVELSKPVVRASGQEQRADQMARAPAVDGRSVRRISSRTQAFWDGQMHGLFCRTVDRRTVGVGYWRNAPSTVCASAMRPSEQTSQASEVRRFSRTPQWGPPRSGSLREPPQGGPHCGAIPATDL